MSQKQMVIRLRDMLFHAHHGVFDYEKAEGNTFRVTVCLTTPNMAGAEADDIGSTLDYRDVYEIVAREMAQPSDLIEHVAWRIQKALKTAFPEAQEVRVVVGKKNPPLGGEVAWGETEVN